MRIREAIHTCEKKKEKPFTLRLAKEREKEDRKRGRRIEEYLRYCTSTRTLREKVEVTDRISILLLLFFYEGGRSLLISTGAPLTSRNERE